MSGACVWTSSAGAWPAQAFGPSEAADLVVVGGGILGLSTALRAVRSGRSVRVIEASDIGTGASGLNGGQVIPGLKYDPETLIERLGVKRGEALARFGAATADAVFDLIEREHLAVPRQRKGWIQAAHTQAAADAAGRRARQWQARGVDARVLSASDIAELTGAKGYVGGWLDPRAGVIDPLAYTRELARLATEAGARIATNTRASRVERRALSRTPSRAAIASGIKWASLIGARSTSDTPSRNESTSPAARRLASRVLPTPPVPTSVTNRDSARCRRSS